MDLVIPKNYKPILGVEETEKAIKTIKDFFQVELARELNLKRVTAPMFVRSGTGINDTLTGVEKPISFKVKNDNYSEVEIVQSLAKWKRMALADYGFKVGEGLYTDMNAIRPDDRLDNLHSIYVDQWDWEKVITNEQRNLGYLRDAVDKIYKVTRETEVLISEEYPGIEAILPEKISFIYAEELKETYPNLTPGGREDRIAKEKGAVFIIGIGAELADGNPHDIRAPDYDDWTTATSNKTKGLNGDILVWYPMLEKAFELSSMGIRVDKKALLTQLEICGQAERKKLLFHKRLLNDELPLCIGGGIGQSRLCMFYLKKAHIGEIQAGLWPQEMIDACRESDVFLL